MNVGSPPEKSARCVGLRRVKMSFYQAPSPTGQVPENVALIDERGAARD